MIEKVSLAADHKGVEMKAQIARILAQMGITVKDFGINSEESCDYPDFIFPAAESVANGEAERAIAVCHSGIGSAIAANKVHGVRAALCQSVKEAELCRAHNDANMLVLGSAFVKNEILEQLVKTWLNTPFEGGRHERRVNKIKDYESTH